MFDLDTEIMTYGTPDTVPEVFQPVRTWEPKNLDVINGIFADSLAALSTEMELKDDDAYGMRRAKELSEELRKTCRTITKNNYLMVCSNQIRENVGRTSTFEQKWKTPGGKGVPFYSSLRLKMNKMGTLKRTRKIKGKDHKIIYGVEIEVEVYKSSIWHPYRTAPLTIDFGYGVDDIRENLKYVKKFYGATTYNVENIKLAQGLEDSIALVEEENLQDKLRNEVIDIWEEIEEEFKVERKPKKR